MSTLSKDNKLEEQKRRRNERARAKYASLSEEEKERQRQKRRDAYKRRKQQACEDEARRLLLQQPLEVNDGDQQNSRPCYTDQPVICSSCTALLTDAINDLPRVTIGEGSSSSSTVNTQKPSTQRKILNQMTGSSVTRGTELLSSVILEADTLPEVDDCKYCGAKKFFSETANFCCSDGEVVLKENKLPDILIELFTGKTEEALCFRTYVRTYNNMFAFTSFGVHYDKSLCKRTNGIYTFKIQGQTYHYINQLIPHGGSGMFLQLYFHDTEHELANRMAFSAKLSETVVLKLIEVMKNNPYACFFRSLRHVPNLESHQIVLKTHCDSDQRVFNKPTVSQVAALWVEGEGAEQTYSRHIQVYTNGGESRRVQYYYGCYDPLQYPLLFPLGETGWQPGIRRSGTGNPKKRKRCPKHYTDNATLQSFRSADEMIQSEEQAFSQFEDSKEYVSMREYYAYRFQMRKQNTPGILNTARAFQQYVVDMYVKIETQRLDFHRKRQKLIRTEQLQGVMDSVVEGESKGSNVGQRVILPASFIGGPRDMKRRYVDAMSLVQKYGKPDLFLTMICNPSWPEIKKNMLPTDESQNRVDLCARVFHAKLELLKEELFKKGIFGKVAAYTYVVEFQKRGLPHAHFLIILHPASKLYSTESYDQIVSAELPDPVEQKHLFKMVRKHMIHGPCGDKKPENVCMQGTTTKKCKNKYPKDWAEKTLHGENSYPTYRRRNNGRKVFVRGHELDNKWVVPYNAYLLAKFNCHINVEICSTIKVVKYTYKYIYKGHDKIHFFVNSEAKSSEIDEIKEYQAARWVSPIEAIWRIYRFPLFDIHPAVIHLQLHLENYQSLTFKNDADLRDLMKNKHAKKSMLTEFFRMNATDETAKKLKCTYKEFPEYFVWYPGKKLWEVRKQRDCIGRVVIANPTEGERYFLRLLLLNVKGPKSFADLKSFNGVCVTTFREAAIMRGLFESNNPQEQCLEEAALFHMPYSFRRLFATLLVYFPPADARSLWLKFKGSMSEDFARLPYLTTEEKEHRVLHEINKFLESMGKNINTYSLVHRVLKFDQAGKSTRDTMSEMSIKVTENDISAISLLNKEQKVAFNLIIEAVFVKSKGCFFVDGPGGTGKTFLYRALLAEVRSKGYIALATASCGVAAAILPGGRTAHSRFKIPLDMNPNKMCKVSKQSSLAKLLQRAKLIIWDEAPMAHKAGIEGVDKLFRDLMDSSEIFGSKVIVFGGDFRQVLPVVVRGSKSDFVQSSLITSYIWPELQKIQLKENMRAKSDPNFTEYLLRIGNGTEPVVYDENVEIPAKMLIRYTTEEESLTALINTVYPDFSIFAGSNYLGINRAILTTKNDFVDEINDTLIQNFPGDSFDYISRDTCLDPSQQAILEDFINSLTPNGLPPHRLTLKQNTPIMLLRNIDPPEGLCNGTRLVCRSLKSNVIDAIISSGEFSGKQVFLHRICFRVEDDPNCPISFERIQFPVRLCFAMTINKAQGQTLDFVGIYLREPVFSHGQLYVAISRAKNSNSVKILIRPPIHDITLDTILQRKMDSNLVRFYEISPELSDWTTIGQVLEKQKPQTSRKGTTYQKLVFVDAELSSWQAYVLIWHKSLHVHLAVDAMTTSR
ncbi:uncharacterized protein [Coffea arabica]|uniref:ATP-dependent DNA helicase n=1 Tax=Coffea arabica TaxID=13443 RepID=A0ABM4U1E0_COFAR